MKVSLTPPNRTSVYFENPLPAQSNDQANDQANDQSLRT